jgi:Tfp pilus assembly protein PilF
MAQAVAAVHRTGLVHGDIKARNIMREDGGRYVLTDFGASRDLGTLSSDTSAAIVGTPLYMAPEVLRGARPTPASDIYSLGVVLYHCVTLDYPVNGLTMADVRAAHDAGVRVPLRDARPDLPSAFVEVVERALSADPASRHASAGALESALARAQGDGRAGRARAATGRAWIAAAAVVLLAAAAGGVWWSGRDRGGDAAGGGAPIDRSSIRTVAVLPFDSSGSETDAVVSRGMAELLTARLSEVPSLRVVSQTSARQVRAQDLRLPDAARALGADAFVEGSTQTVAGRTRVNVRLIHARTDSVIWSQSFEDVANDLLRVQADLALAVGRQLRDALTTTEQRRLSATDTTKQAAQDAFLRGWAALEQQTAASTREAVREFETAVTIDPNYARAHAVLSHAYWFLGVGVSAMPLAESAAKARASAQRALEIDPQLPRAHAAVAQVHFYYGWNWKAAESSFGTAVALNPSDADAQQQYGWFLAAMGRFDQALDRMRRARELDPLANTRRSPVAAVLYYSRRYEDAIEELRQALAVNPAYRTAHVGLARAYSGLDRPEDALRELEAAPSDAAAHLAELGRTYAQAGNRARAAEILATLESRRATAPDAVPLDALAFLCAALGRTAPALDYLERALEARSPAMVWLKVDPRYDALRTQPRFVRVLTAMGLHP